MCTQHDFHCSKTNCVHTSTVTGSQSCSGKNTPRVQLVIFLWKVCYAKIFDLKKFVNPYNLLSNCY